MGRVAVLLEKMRADNRVTREALFSFRDELNRKIDKNHEEAKAEFALIKGVLNFHSTQIGELKQDVAELKKDVAELKRDVAELKSDVAELKRNVAALNARVTAIEHRLDRMEPQWEDVRAERAELVDLKRRVAALEAAASQSRS